MFAGILSANKLEEKQYNKLIVDNIFSFLIYLNIFIYFIIIINV